MEQESKAVNLGQGHPWKQPRESVVNVCWNRCHYQAYMHHYLEEAEIGPKVEKWLRRDKSPNESKD